MTESTLFTVCFRCLHRTHRLPSANRAISGELPPRCDYDKYMLVTDRERTDSYLLLSNLTGLTGAENPRHLQASASDCGREGEDIKVTRVKKLQNRNIPDMKDLQTILDFLG